MHPFEGWWQRKPSRRVRGAFARITCRHSPHLTFDTRQGKQVAPPVCSPVAALVPLRRRWPELRLCWTPSAAAGAEGEAEAEAEAEAAGAAESLFVFCLCPFAFPIPCAQGRGDVHGVGE